MKTGECKFIDVLISCFVKGKDPSAEVKASLWEMNVSTMPSHLTRWQICTFLRLTTQKQAKVLLHKTVNPELLLTQTGWVQRAPFVSDTLQRTYMFCLPFKVSCRELHVLKKPIPCLDTSPLVEGCNPLPSVPKNDFQRKRGCCRLLGLREEKKKKRKTEKSKTTTHIPVL